MNELRERIEAILREEWFRPGGTLEDAFKRAALRLQERELDAERWRALMGCPRVRFIGGARLGEPDALLGVEFYADYPPEMRDDNSHAVGLLTTFADNLLAAPASPPVSGEREAWHWWDGPNARFRCPKCGGTAFGSSEVPTPRMTHCHSNGCRWSGPRSESMWLMPGTDPTVRSIPINAVVLARFGPPQPSQPTEGSVNRE